MYLCMYVYFIVAKLTK